MKKILTMFCCLFTMVSCFAICPESKIKNLPDINTTNNKIFLDYKYGHIQGNGASPWYGELFLGSNLQQQKYLLDTGTTFSWTTSTDCKNEAAANKTKFNYHSSSSYKEIDPKIKEYHFGPWGKLYAKLGEDNLRGGLIGTTPFDIRFPIHIATYYDGEQFKSLLHDAGIAFQCDFDNNEEKKEDLLKNLGSYISHEVVSFTAKNKDFINSTDNEGLCTIGAVNKDIINNSRFNAMKTDKGKDWRYKYSYRYKMWNMKTQSLYCDGIKIASFFATTIDTGSSKIKGDSKIINKLISAVTKGDTLPDKVYDPSKFNRYPDIIFTINYRIYRIPPKQYFIKKKGNAYWELGLRGFDDKQVENQLVLGSIFYENKYSVFYRDRENNQFVGVADLKKETANTSGIFLDLLDATEQITFYAKEGFNANDINVKFENGTWSRKKLSDYIIEGKNKYFGKSAYVIKVSTEDGFITELGGNKTIGEIINPTGTFRILDSGHEQINLKAKETFNAKNSHIKYFFSKNWERSTLSTFLEDGESEYIKGNEYTIIVHPHDNSGGFIIDFKQG